MDTLFVADVHAQGRKWGSCPSFLPFAERLKQSVRKALTREALETAVASAVDSPAMATADSADNEKHATPPSGDAPSGDLFRNPYFMFFAGVLCAFFATVLCRR